MKRARSVRGEGVGLRAEIVATAAELLETNGNEAAVTLRAIARGVGITAPAIYAHFPDREAILEAVVSEAFDDLVERVRSAGAGSDDARLRLFAGCHAYIEFAREQPARYRVLFERSRDPQAGTLRPADTVDSLIGASAFDVLVDSVAACIASGDSVADEPLAPATALWVALHGYVTLQSSVPGFPWPAGDALADDLIATLARLSRS